MTKVIDKRKVKKQIGFVVEGTTDANFINYLVKEYFKNRFAEIVITTSGKAAMTSSFRIITSSLLNEGVDHIFAIFDVDDLPIKKHLNYLNKQLEKQGIKENVSLIPINPFLEIWLLYAHLEKVDNISKMDKEDQQEKIKSLGYKKKPIRFEKSEIDFTKMLRNKEFKNFVDLIEETI